METPNTPADGGNRSLVDEAERLWRTNPIGVVLGAIGIGLLIGALVRSMEPKSRTDRWKDRLEDSEDYVRELAASLSKLSRKGYKKSAHAVKDTLERAVDAAREIDDDYVEPAGKWFRRLWKRCCT